MKYIIQIILLIQSIQITIGQEDKHVLTLVKYMMLHSLMVSLMNG